MDSVGFMFAGPGAAPEELFLRSMICCVIQLLSFGASVNDCNLQIARSHLGHLACQREAILLSRGMLEFKVFWLMSLQLLVGN
jgi:hypothetical protein